VLGNLTWARARYESIHGTVRSDWTRRDDDFTLHVGIPPNTTATVALPTSDLAAVTENGQPLNQAENAKLVRVKDGRVWVSIDSGDYLFEIRK
jgi:alpha-L-rhamnosidase